MNPKELFERADGTMSFPIGKSLYRCPGFRVIELGSMLDVCANASNPNGNTDSFDSNPGEGWEDEFNN